MTLLKRNYNGELIIINFKFTSYLIYVVIGMFPTTNGNPLALVENALMNWSGQ